MGAGVFAVPCLGAEAAAGEAWTGFAPEEGLPGRFLAPRTTLPAGTAAATAAGMLVVWF